MSSRAMDSSTVVVYSEHHGNRILKRLKELWEDELYCDVVIRVGEQLIKAHRVVLCAGSRYFSTMLSSGLKESYNQEEPIALQTVDPRAAETLVKYMYTGEMLLDHQLVEPMLYAADMLDMPEAVNLCCRFLLKSLTAYNALYTLRLADRHHNQELYNAALNIVSSQFTEVVKSIDFISSPPNQAIDLLNNDNLDVETEIPVLQGAFAWLKHNNLLRDYEPGVPDTAVQESQNQELGDKSSDQELRGNSSDQELGGKSSDQELGGKSSDQEPGGKSSDQESAVTSDVQPLSDKELKVRQDMISAIRFRLLPLKYLKGLGDDIVARICEKEVKDAITQRKSLPDLRKPCKRRNGMFSGKIYIVGGTGSSLAELSSPRLNLEVFDPVHSEWAKQPEPDFMRHNAHVGVLVHLEGYVYVVGGSDSSGKPGNLVHRLNIVTGEWAQVQSLVTSTTRPGVCVYQGMIYVAGGWNGTDALSTFERYEPIIDSWKKLRNMNRCRMEFPLVVCRDKIFAVCGNTSDYTNVAQSLEVYDPITNGWSELLPSIRPRWCPGAASIRDYIIVCGLPGKDRTGLRSADKLYTVERYSVATGQWSILPALKNPVGGANLVNLHGTLYVLGGSDGTAPLASCCTAQRYDEHREEWQNIPSMNVARVGASITVT